MEPQEKHTETGSKVFIAQTFMYLSVISLLCQCVASYGSSTRSGILVAYMLETNLGMRKKWAAAFSGSMHAWRGLLVKWYSGLYSTDFGIYETKRVKNLLMGRGLNGSRIRSQEDSLLGRKAKPSSSVNKKAQLELVLPIGIVEED